MQNYSTCKPAIIDDLLLNVLNVRQAHGTQTHLEPLREEQGEELVIQATRHGIAPYLYHQLRTFHPDTVIPAVVADKLRQAHLGNSARTMMLFNNLHRVLKLFQDHHIPVIALKGAHLAELIYPHRALRYMGDLDLLVKQEDLLRADALLLDMGCTTTDHSRSVGDDNNEFVYAMPKRDVSLEIHWMILPPQFPFTIDTNGLWERSKPALIDGVNVRILCPEDLLLHLCVHAGCTHGFEPGLKLFCDISELLRHHRQEINWTLVRQRSQEWGVNNCVYLTLKLSVDLFGVNIPEDVMTALKPDNFDNRFTSLATDQIFSRRPRTGPPLSLWPAVAKFWGTTRLRDKISLFVKGFFISKTAMSRLYPAPAESFRINFYYFVRLKDLFRVYGRDVWRWLRRDSTMKALAKEGKDLTALKDWLASGIT